MIPIFALGGRAEVTLAPLFADHAVLQQGRPVPVWGRAAPGENVSVTFRDQTATATADQDGRWIVYLDPLRPGAPADLIVSGKNTIRREDILVGDVWICSGQSNMEFMVWGPPGDVYGVDHADEEVAAAHYPLIRHFKIERDPGDRPPAQVHGSWAVCSPATVGKFTAVGYFFARDLQRRTEAPIGLINSSWGGSPVESWMSAAALASDPAFAVVRERWREALAAYPTPAAYEKAHAEFKKAEAAAIKEWLHAPPGSKRTTLVKLGEVYQHMPHGPDDPFAPEVLFDTMIEPIIPYGLRGVLWYQGESNAGHPTEYHALFAALITDWRRRWGQGDFPFYWVQLPNFGPTDPDGTDWPRLREGQAQTLSLPHTGMAVTIDVGNRDDAHPRNKQEVGRRLALIAGHEIYGVPGGWSGPMFKAAEREGAAMRVHFAHVNGALVTRGQPPPAFAVAGADRRFFPAAARIDGDTLLVSAPEVTAPVAVRYAWTNAPDASLFDSIGLPAAPFRSDDW
ncbi:MAG: sialate O-acetylesterase [Opitutaceae bacterium]